MAIISTEAIVLRSLDHRETSRLTFFFTRKCGRIIGVLKGIRKDPRKFGSSVDRLTVNDIVYYEYRNSDIYLVSQCDMKEFFFGIRQESRRILAGEYAAELVNKIMPLGEPNPGVYDLLLEFLRAEETAVTSEDVSRLVHTFQIKLLALSGFRPHLDSCVRCSKGVTPQAMFSVRLGGLVCVHCVRSSGDMVRITPNAVAMLLYIEQHDWSACLKLRMPAPLRVELRMILNNFLLFHLGKNIKSAKYLS